jgi:hypothetical protein
MWPFDAPKGARGARSEAAESPADPELSDRLSRLEREFLALQTEWADTLDKIGRHFARQSARDRQRLHRDLSSLENPSENDPGATISDGVGSRMPPDAKARLRAAVNARRLGRGAV